MLRFQRRPICREPLFRRGHRHRRAQGQRPVTAGAELGAVLGLGKGPLHRFLVALFLREPVLGVVLNAFLEFGDEMYEAIPLVFIAVWIASWSLYRAARRLSSGAHSRDPVAPT